MMAETVNRIWVKESVASRVIRSLLSSDTAITNAYKYGEYDKIVNSTYAEIGDGKLFKVEYKGNVIGFFIVDAKLVLKKYFLKPEVRSPYWLDWFNSAIFSTPENKNTQIGIEKSSIKTIINYQNII